jgi:hypothetical protein
LVTEIAGSVLELAEISKALTPFPLAPTSLRETTPLVELIPAMRDDVAI